MSAPLQKRVEQLYTYGYNAEAITNMVVQEFQDIEAFPISHELIKMMIDKNQSALEEARTEYLKDLSSSLIADMRVLLEKGAESDNKIVGQMLKKEDEVLTAMDALDITVIEEGKAQELMLFLSYLEALERINKLKAKLTGMDAWREFEIFKRKEELKSKLSSVDLIPDVKKNGVTILDA